MSTRNRDFDWVDVMQAADEGGRCVRTALRRKQARTVLSAVFGVVAALTITALLALPHLTREPVEVTAEIEEEPQVRSKEASEATATPRATATPFTQHEDALLILVNGETPLPQDYTLHTRSYDGVEVGAVMYTELCAMLDAAAEDGCVLWLASGYRSREKQASILEKAVDSRMQDGLSREAAYRDARLTIQAPGYSEHHTGLAIDFNNVDYDFETSEAYGWLRENAAKYGFVERYPKDKAQITCIEYEPWHYRYVGKVHAERMTALGLCLEEYIAYCKENGI